MSRKTPRKQNGCSICGPPVPFFVLHVIIKEKRIGEKRYIMAKGDNQKLKMLYLVQIFSESTDDTHGLTMPEVIEKLSACQVNADRKTL